LGAALPKCPSLTKAGRVKGFGRSAAVRKAAAVATSFDLVPFMEKLRTVEGLSLHAITERLNADEIRQPSRWSWLTIGNQVKVLRHPIVHELAGGGGCTAG
jgi:hypothetical protein